MPSTPSQRAKNWCAREDLNLQSFRNQILSLARLPFRHARVAPEHARRAVRIQGRKAMVQLARRRARPKKRVAVVGGDTGLWRPFIRLRGGSLANESRKEPVECGSAP